VHNRRFSEAQPTDKHVSTTPNKAPHGARLWLLRLIISPLQGLKNCVGCCRSVGSAALHLRLCTSHPCGVKIEKSSTVLETQYIASLRFKPITVNGYNIFVHFIVLYSQKIISENLRNLRTLFFICDHQRNQRTLFFVNSVFSVVN
jgi:hypothetical protein